MEEHALLQQEQQELATESALVGSRRGWVRTVAVWSVSLAIVVVAGTTAAPYLRAEPLGKAHSLSKEDLVLLARAGHEDVPKGTNESKNSRPKVTAMEAAKKKKQEAEAEAAALKSAEQVEEQAKGFKKHADDLLKNSTDLNAKHTVMLHDVADTKAAASKERKSAEEARSRAQELRDQADKLQKQASGLDVKAKGLDQDAVAKDGEAAQTEQKAGRLAQQAASLLTKSKTQRQNAVDADTKAMEGTAAQRLCVDLPGVRLDGSDPKSFAPVVGNHSISDDVQCKLWCLNHADCKQSVWTWETKKCELFSEATPQPKAFKDTWPWYNSSYCGLLSEKDQLLDMLHKVFDMKPWVTPPHNCSFGGQNCIHTLCCADHCRADAMFEKCEDYTCWKRDEYWAGCTLGGAEYGWEGTTDNPDGMGVRLGGHPNREVEPAPEGKLIQGTRLYCFSVVMWQSSPPESWQNSEAELANHWKEQGKGILQCDDYSMFDGLEGGSVHNIPSFIRAWKMVKDDGRWKNNDWVVKVDPDAVFFPDHLRKKIEWVYRTPQGSAVYLRNTFYKFQFLGALEAMTREAMEVYFDRGWECEAHLTQEGGEDYWLLQCLEGIGVDYQTDVGLLHDKYASDENCGDPNSVAHHFFKKIVGAIRPLGELAAASA